MLMLALAFQRLYRLTNWGDCFPNQSACNVWKYESMTAEFYVFDFPIPRTLHLTDLQITLIDLYTFHTGVPQSYSIKILRMTVEINWKPRGNYLRSKGLILVSFCCALKLPQSHCGDDDRGVLFFSSFCKTGKDHLTQIVHLIPTQSNLIINVYMET